MHSPVVPSPIRVFPRITASFNSEKLAGKGEDADPIVLVWDSGSILLGVFDGMGGAGSAIYAIGGKEHTGAYIAARLAREETYAYFSGSAGLGSEALRGEVAAEGLEKRLRSELDRMVSRVNGGTAPSALRSRLLKRFPTTAALLHVALRSDDACEVQVVWAGDSRCYVLTPERGLQQLTRDDTAVGDDPLESLRNDAPLSNCINADTEFHLNHRSVTLSLPFIGIAATDGCFGYLPSPAHVEYILLQTLRSASDAEEWQELLRREFTAISGDDASLALACIGCRDFAELKTRYRNRRGRLVRDVIRPVNRIEKEFTRLDAAFVAAQRKKEDCQTRRESIRRATWDAYKLDYAHYLASTDNGAIDANSSPIGEVDG